MPNCRYGRRFVLSRSDTSRSHKPDTTPFARLALCCQEHRAAAAQHHRRTRCRAGNQSTLDGHRRRSCWQMCRAGRWLQAARWRRRGRSCQPSICEAHRRGSEIDELAQDPSSIAVQRTACSSSRRPCPETSRPHKLRSDSCDPPVHTNRLDKEWVQRSQVDKKIRLDMRC